MSSHMESNIPIFSKLTCSINGVIGVVTFYSEKDFIIYIECTKNNKISLCFQIHAPLRVLIVVSKEKMKKI